MGPASGFLPNKLDKMLRRFVPYSLHLSNHMEITAVIFV